MDLHNRSIGINFGHDGAKIKVWAPLAKQVAITLHPEEVLLPLQKGGMGYWHLSTEQLSPDSLYSFVVDENENLPDPASLSQPQGVHMPSRSVDLSIIRSNQYHWQNPPLENYIIYELHVGTFSEEGTFRGVEKKLDHLIELGITAIEIMPVTSFPGERNWGYDGVFPFSVQENYGGIDGLARLINTCHQKNMAVILDVVYNHLGPEGNYLPNFGPYFTDKYQTPWGKAVNFDDAYCDGVREYFIENAMMWFRDLGVDALRLDAVHAIKDFSTKHILEDLASYTRQLTNLTGRSHYLIGECDLNNPKYIRPLDRNGFGLHAQWADEFHHSLRTCAGEPPIGYYSDFNGVEHLAKAYASAYVYDGQYSEHRKKHFGAATFAPGESFVVFSQNHDQVGNRMLGERSSTLVSYEMQKLFAASVAVSPFLSMLFMGEEYGETNPFQYFVSHTDAELAKLVTEGRRKEFSSFHTDGEAPDPMDPQTFDRSKLNWALKEEGQHKTMFEYYKMLIKIRKKWFNLNGNGRDGISVNSSPETKTLVLTRNERKHSLYCFMNFSRSVQKIKAAGKLDGSSVLLNTAAHIWGGPGDSFYKRAEDSVTIQPESMIIFLTQNV